MGKIIFFIVYILFSISYELSAQSPKIELTAIDTVGFNYYPSVSPDGNFIAYIKMTEDDYFIYGNIWLYDIRSDTSNIIIKGGHHIKGQDGHLSWSKDSKKVFFSSSDSILSYNIYTGDIELLYQTNYSKTRQNAFGPMINSKGSKIAFWKIDYSGGYGKIIHSINSLNLEGKKAEEVHTEPYDPRREVTFYNPQWGDDDRYLYATFFDTVGIRLVELDVKEVTSRIIAHSVYSSYFKVVGSNLYYTRYNHEYKNAYLVCYNKKTGKSKIVNENQNGVFDVDTNGTIFFSRNDSLYIKFPNQLINIGRGNNPSIQYNSHFLFEKWIQNNGNEFINQLYMMRAF